MPKERKWFRPHEVDDVLGLFNNRTVKMMRAGAIDFVILPSGDLRVPKSEIDRLLAEGMVSGPED